MRVLAYSPEWFDRLVAFLKANWAPSHALYDRPLFDWQYRTDRATDSLMVVEQDALLGFLGGIPARYQLGGRVIRGVGLTLWCVARHVRDAGLGVILMRRTERDHEVTLTLGAGARVLELYARMGYALQRQLHRYVAPLDEAAYQKLLPAPAREVSSWAQAVRPVTDSAPLPPSCSDTAALEALDKRSVHPRFSFSQIRDADFWRWRYLESQGFRYHVFGRPSRDGAVVARVERVVAPDRPDLAAVKVLRLIELVPAGPQSWESTLREPFARLIAGVLRWGREAGCGAVDFQCTSRRLGPTLTGLGMRRMEQGVPELALSPMFQPLRPNVAPLNFLWKIRDGGPLDPEDAYFVKSDCDMDRPVVWPLPDGG